VGNGRGGIAQASLEAGKTWLWPEHFRVLTVFRRAISGSGTDQREHLDRRRIRNLQSLITNVGNDPPSAIRIWAFAPGVTPSRLSLYTLSSTTSSTMQTRPLTRYSHPVGLQQTAFGGKSAILRIAV
jgi:hypothetical protein